MKAQTHTDWEWVIWDDSDNDSVWRQVYGFCSDERYRVAAHRSHVHSGSIGEVKRKAFMVSSGEAMVELDHDDELLPNALSEIQIALDNYADVGFFYSDWAEILPDGSSGRYPQGWAFGYGSDYWLDEHKCWVMRAPEVNSTTIRHIVSAPNHVRVWRAELYRSLGGHNGALPVADDYELVVRTFIESKFGHIPKFLYRQHIGGHTAQRKRNGQIQVLVAEIAAKYKEALDARLGM